MQNLLELLRDKNARITPAREAILNSVYFSTSPINAKKVLRNLEKKNIKVNKTTVYRELYFLVQNNFLKEVYLKPGVVHYESALLPHHHHLVCNDCGSVTEVDCLIDENELALKAKQKGFALKNHKFELYGLCVNCG